MCVCVYFTSYNLHDSIPNAHECKWAIACWLWWRERDPAVREGCEASWMIAWGFLGSHDGICCVLFFFSTCHQRGERKKKHTYIQRMSRLVVFMGPDKAGRHLRTACVSGCVNPPLVIYISLFPPVLSPGSPFSPQLDYNLRDKMRLNNEHCLDNVSDTSLLPVTDWLRQQRNDKLRLGNGMSHGAGWWAALRRETHKIVFSRS